MAQPQPLAGTARAGWVGCSVRMPPKASSMSTEDTASASGTSHEQGEPQEATGQVEQEHGQHLARVLTRLGVETRAGAIVAAFESGLARPRSTP